MVRATTEEINSPALAVVVIIYNMRREAPRTLFSLSADFQQHVSAEDYEVIVVDNGSSEPLSEAEVKQFGGNFKYYFIEDAPASPAYGINFGVSHSKAANVGIMIDGARMVSPGVISLSLQALRRFERAVVGTIPFHVGPDTQHLSPKTHGYSQEVEDQLFEGIDWRKNGYKLFEISSLAGAARRFAWFGPLRESNFVCLPRTLFDELGGCDERFDLPGGGYVNLDFYRRAAESPETTLITLFGEGNFHQIHGGISTNREENDLQQELQRYRDQYGAIRGGPYVPSKRSALLLGHYRPEIAPILEKLYKSSDS